MSYKRGIPYVYANQTEEEERDDIYTVHFWGENDDSCKDTIWYENYKDKGIELSGINMTMQDLDEIVIKRLNEIVKEEYGSDKYKKIERMFNEKKRWINGQKN